MARSNNVYKLITDKRTIPFNSAGSGTIQTIGKVILGTSTKFMSEMQMGSYLYYATTNEVYRVNRVDSDIRAYLDVAFASDIPAATTPQIIPNIDARPFEISVIIPSVLSGGGVGVKGLVNGQYLPVGIARTINRSTRERSSKSDLIDPMVVDATGTEMLVSVTY